MKGLPHSPDIIRTIREGLVAGLTYSEIGDPLGLSRSAVAGIAHRHARGVGRASNFRNADSCRFRSLPKREQPEIVQAVSAAVGAGMTDAAVARATGLSWKTVGAIRDVLANKGIDLPRNPATYPDAGRMATLRGMRHPKAAAPTPSGPIPPKPSAFILRGLTLVSSTPRPVQPASTSWTEQDIVRLREACRTEATSAECAKALGRPYSSVRHMMTELGLQPVYQPQEQHWSAIERLHREGQSVRRICIRTGVPIPLVVRHLKNVSAHPDKTIR